MGIKADRQHSVDTRETVPGRAVILGQDRRVTETIAPVAASVITPPVVEPAVLRPRRPAGRVPVVVTSAPTAIDLFSGAGGLSLGALRAGFDVRLAAEIEPTFAATHAANLPGAVLTADLRTVPASQVLDLAGVVPGELDVLFGGPPCQGFSVIGPRVVWDKRNNLFLEVLRLAQELRPKAVVIENVPGLTSLGGGRYLASILEGLGALGYQAATAEVLAAQYGVPQMRWRLLIVAWRDDLDIAPGWGFPDPTHGTCALGDLVSNTTIPDAAMAGFLTTRDAIGDLPAVEVGTELTTYRGRPRGGFQAEVRTLPDGQRMPSSELHDHYAPALSKQNLARIAALRPGQDWRDLPFELLPGSMQRAKRKDHTRRYRRMTWDGVPRSIITRFRDPKSGEYIHPDQDRTISIREAMRIQGFPDWFALEGTNTAKYTQVGNAVPVPLGQAIAAEVRACLDGTPQSRRLEEPFRRRPLAFIGHHGELVGHSSDPA